MIPRWARGQTSCHVDPTEDVKSLVELAIVGPFVRLEDHLDVHVLDQTERDFIRCVYDDLVNILASRVKG